ncbi:MAG: histidine kinase [Acidobacteriia bacterium]|nr:histidine kinase [Terriglobia bacterium]
MNPTLYNSPALILVTLLIKLGVIASLASIIARFGQFRRLLFEEQRSPRQKLVFAAFLGVPFMLGVLTRLLARYQGIDLSLEMTVVSGLLGGTIVGLVVGTMVSLPAVLIGHEILATPVAVLCAVAAGSARWVCPDKEEVWKFSPFIDLSLYRSIKRRFQHPAMDWQVLFFLICVILEIARMTFGHMAHGRLFYLDAPQWWGKALIVLGTAIGVGLPVRIWNNTRIERKLEEQERLLMQARVDALISQINPHFLFNTLNTVSSLVRFDPDTARKVVLKLSNILRRRLKTQDIEVVRFGKDKLQIRKEIDPGTLDLIVPSMILQPLVENAIRHGIGPKIEGGTITLRSRRQNGRLAVEVIDDGMGFPDNRPPESFDSGIGIRNVRERLKALYGQEFSFAIDSAPGKGTAIRLEIPEVAITEKAAPVETAGIER